MEAGSARERERRLAVLERLLALETTSLKEALEQAATLVGESLGAEKVDALLFSQVRGALVAVGVSDTPLGHRERQIGMDVVSLETGGSITEVYETRRAVLIGNVDHEANLSRGIVDDLGVRSLVAVPLEVSDSRRGVLAATSTRRDAFDDDDLTLLQAVAHWVGLTARRSLLLERAGRADDERNAVGSSAHLALDMARRTEEERTVAADARTAEDTSVLRDHVLSVVAHDLRTPLTNIQGRVQLISRRIDKGRDIGPDWLREQVDSLQTSTERLLGMIRELTDASALVHGGPFELHTAELDLVRLTQTIVNEMHPDSGIDLLTETPDTPIYVIGDQVRLERVVQNLLDNAVKYSPSGSAICVRVRIEECMGVISVQDEGVGIPEDEVGKVFTPYYRASTSTGVEGTGLGLASARTVIEQLAGSIDIQSELGVGTTVTVRLPLAHGAAG